VPEIAPRRALGVAVLDGRVFVVGGWSGTTTQLDTVEILSDGRWIAVGGSAQSVFERICHALDRPDLIDAPEFADNRARVANDVALDEQLQAAIGQLDYATLMDRFERYEAAAAPVQDVQQIIEHPQVVARGNIATIDDPELGAIRMQDVVGRLSETPGHIDHAGPVHGSSNAAILVERLGFDPEALRAAGIDVGLSSP
jgi:formyl-CoA transferase